MRVEIPLRVTPESEVHENCALVGIAASNPSTEIYEMLADGLIALQHRGEEAVGVSFFNNDGVEVYKSLGLVIPELINSKRISKFPQAKVVLGHTRYSTVPDDADKEKEVQNSQPFYFRIPHGNGFFFDFSIAHNGTVRTPEGLTSEHGPNSDTYMIGRSIVNGEGTFEDRVKQTLSSLNGAYNLLFVTSDDRLYIATDPWGFKPGVYGAFSKDGISGIAFASETIALEKMDITPDDYVDRGVFAEIKAGGIRQIWEDPRTDELPWTFCTFEKAYFGDAPSKMNGETRTNHYIRKLLGKRLAQRNLDFLREVGDVVAPVPDSGISYADGVVEGTGIPIAHPIQKSRYAGRAFIKNRPVGERWRDVKKKLTFILEEIAGKRLIVVDDSIVRGNTMRRIVAELFNYGAERVTLLLGIPPISHPCFYGIDFSSYLELIYNQLGVENGTPEEYEDALAAWLVDHNPDLLSRIDVIFQRQEDYVEIVQNVPHGTPIETSGGCFHCVSGIVPLGTTTP